jgi:succinate semialdehyde reductase (NADPH)
VKAAVVREVSGPFEIEELRDPEPGPGELLVEVAACGVCHTDLHVHDGSVKFPFPCVLGHEISGTVLATGDGVTSVSPGTRVAAAFIMPCGTCAQCRAGREELCEPFFAHNRLAGTLYDGSTRLFDRRGDPIAMYSMAGLSELAVMPALAAAPLPDELPLADSAIFGCALLTAHGAVRHVADLQAGESAVVIGVGGVGASIVQLARAFGADPVVAIDVADDKLEAAVDSGATAVVNSTGGGLEAAVLDHTEGRGGDVVFEAVGSPRTFRLATELVADGGRCVMIGIAANGVLGEVEITRLVRRKIQILGSFGGRPRHDLPGLMQMALDGKLDPTAMISRRYALDEAGEAYSALARAEIVGRAIVEIPPR